MIDEYGNAIFTSHVSMYVYLHDSIVCMYYLS